MNTVFFTVAAYLLGSISFAVVVSKLFGLADPRSYGSKNPGATNVLRSGNKLAAILTLLGDAVKGWLAVWLAERFALQYGVGELGIALVALAVFVGHLWPVFFKFKGGKGVATALGILLAINVWLGLATLITWGLVAFIFRYSSLAALVASALTPFYYGMQSGMDEKLLAVLAISGLLLFRHSQNIANLMAGKEGRLGGKQGPGTGIKGKGKHR